MEFSQHEIMGIELSELSYRCLKIIVFQRHIIVVGSSGALTLVECIEVAVGVGSAMIHIITKKITSASQLHDSHGIGILRGHQGTTVIGCRHTTSELTGEIGVLQLILVHVFFLFTQLLRSYCRRTTEGSEVECLVIVAHCRSDTSVPESVSIVAIKGKHLSIRYGGTQLGPSCSCIERQVETNLFGYPLQCHQIASFTPIFIVKLRGNDRSTILPLQPLYLSKDLSVQASGITKEGGILFPHLTSLVKHPVRNTSVSHLSMAEGSHSEHHRHVLLFAEFYKPSQVSSPIPVEHSFPFLDMVPEHIGSDDRHPSFFHLSYLLLPFVLGQSRVMDFAHHGHHSFSVKDKTCLIPFDRLGWNLCY